MASGMVEAGSREAWSRGQQAPALGAGPAPFSPCLSSPQANHLVQPFLGTAPFTEWTNSCLSSFLKAAVTNNHRLGGLKQ